MEHGVLANVIEGRLRYKRSEALVTFAEYLHDVGYDTGAFVSALPLKKNFELDAGFEVYYNPRGKPAQPANETVEVVLGWLQHRGSRPLFLWLHLFDPHSPYDPPAPLDEMYRSDDALERYVDARRFSEEATRPTGPVNVLREGINTYDGEIRFVDEQLGRVLSALRARPRWKDTVVIVLADHGEGLNQHDEPGHGLVWDEQLHVPLLIRAPGVPPARVAGVMSVVDVLPTLLGILELPEEDRFLAQASGRDVLRPDADTIPVFSQTSARQNKFGEEYTYALTSDDWKYILTKSGEEQLYDLGSDPYELEDVAAANAEVTARLRDRVRATIARQLRRARELESGGVRALSPEEADGLRGLGYGGGDEDGD